MFVHETTASDLSSFTHVIVLHYSYFVGFDGVGDDGGFKSGYCTINSKVCNSLYSCIIVFVVTGQFAS